MGNGLAAHYDAYEEDEVYRFLDEGIPALLAEGEVYLTDAFRSMQAAPPKISVGVSVHGSVLDLEVDTGEFPVGELKALLRSLHQKKRYHRLRDGRRWSFPVPNWARPTPGCPCTGPPVWTGRFRGRTASASTGTMPSVSSAGASMR